MALGLDRHAETMMADRHTKSSRIAYKTGTSAILPRSGSRAKSEIVSAGLALGTVAAAAGIHKTSLSNYLAGRTRSPLGQLRILMAFAELSGRVVRFSDFWGELAGDLPSAGRASRSRRARRREAS